MRIVPWTATLILLTLTSGCMGINAVRGSGTSTTESRMVSDFTGIEVSGSAKLIIEQSETEALTVTTDDNLQQYVTAEVKDSKLRLGTKPSMSLSPSDRITYKVLVKNLTVLGASGDVVVQAGGLRTDSITVAISGSGDIRISGDATEQKIAISGSANYDAEDLHSKDATLSISGSGKAVLAVSDRLDVMVSGSGDVEYIGTPQITQSISGSGSVRRRQG
jgi:hypothetical protein